MTPTKGSKRGLVLWFAAGAFVIASLGWAWVDSAMRQRTAYWRATGSEALLLGHRWGDIEIQWASQGALYGQPPGPVGLMSHHTREPYYFGHTLPKVFSQGGGLVDYATTGVYVPYWLLVTGTGAIWITLPWWLRRRRRRQMTHLQAEDLPADP